jgi:archaeal chaperonin
MSNVQPIFILPEGTERSQGKSAQRNNIMAARAVADTVRTTLGPKGMDKMLIDTMGDVIVTNDGVTILKEMSVQHPSAKLIVEVAKTQEAEVGDGTTTAVVIAGELLKRAEFLLEQDIHPTVISRGFIMAEEKAQAMLSRLGEPVTEKDTVLLERIAETAMTGKGAEGDRTCLAKIAIDAVRQVADSEDGRLKVSLDDIKIEKKTGGKIDDSMLVRGVLVDKERLHEGMPSSVEKAKIALIDCAIEIKSTEIDAKIQIEEPGQLQSFLLQEENMLRSMVDKIAKSGAKVVFCQKGIDDMAQHFLAKKAIYACRRVKKSDMERLAAATGGSIVSNLDELADSDLGFAGIVEEVSYGDESMTLVKDCRNPKSVTILIRGSTNHVIDEIKRAMDDAIGDLAAALVVGKVVAGAGSVEIELSRGLRRFAESLSGREQLAVMAFADALEIIPKTLAENGGLDPIDIMTELKSQHEKGNKWAGVDVNRGAVMDAWKEGVIEPLKIKTQCLSSATEVATMVLRIDDVIAAGSSGGKGPKMPGPEGMPY